MLNRVDAHIYLKRLYHSDVDTDFTYACCFTCILIKFDFAELSFAIGKGCFFFLAGN